MRNIFFHKKFRSDQRTHLSRYQKAWQETPDLAPARLPVATALKLLILGGLIGLAGWFIFGSTYFTVMDIDIKGVVSPQTESIINQLRGRNIFFLGNRSTELKLLQQEPTLKAIRIVRGLPGFLQLEVLEREGYMTWHSGGASYWLDRDGVAFRILDTPRGTVIFDEANLPVTLGTKVVAKDFLTFIESLSTAMPSASGLNVTKIIVGESTFSIRVVTDKGVEVVFNTIDQVDRQLDALARIWAAKQSDITRSIDVRVPGYVYYQ